MRLFLLVCIKSKKLLNKLEDTCVGRCIIFTYSKGNKFVLIFKTHSYNPKRKTLVKT